jgi:hypothetical protein
MKMAGILGITDGHSGRLLLDMGSLLFFLNETIWVVFHSVYFDVSLILKFSSTLQLPGEL